jgi:hypothetical protein
LPKGLFQAWVVCKESWAARSPGGQPDFRFAMSRPLPARDGVSNFLRQLLLIPFSKALFLQDGWKNPPGGGNCGKWAGKRVEFRRD